MMNIKSGDIVVWKRRNLFAKIIKASTDSSYTHVGVVWVFAGRAFVIEATPQHHVRVFPLDKMKPFYVIQYDGSEWNVDMETFAFSIIGESYSFMDALMGLFGRAKSDDFWQCAELVAFVKSKETSSKSVLLLPQTPAKLVEYFMAKPNAKMTKVE